MRKHFKLKMIVYMTAVCAVIIMSVILLRTSDNKFLNHLKTKALMQLDPIDISAVSSEDDGWQLMLVNAENPLPEGYVPELVVLKNGHKIDKRVYPSLQKMFDDARSEGIHPMISSSYRTSAQQQAELDEKTEEYINQGYSPSRALEIAKTWVAVPGRSEHQTGLALDITTADASVQSAETVWKWLSENSYKYGFILRYPENKIDITGISNEPWHFRYVGKAAAKEIYKRGLCLEEYLKIIRQR